MIEVHVDSAPDFAGVRFWILDRHPNNGHMYVLRMGKHNVTYEDMGADGAFLLPEPTFSLGRDHAQQFIKQMAEVAATRGIKLEADLKREGKLEAVSEHLSDMRKLVFEKPPAGAPVASHPLGCVYVMAGIWTRERGCRMEHNSVVLDRGDH